MVTALIHQGQATFPVEKEARITAMASFFACKKTGVFEEHLLRIFHKEYGRKVCLHSPQMVLLLLLALFSVAGPEECGTLWDHISSLCDTWKRKETKQDFKTKIKTEQYVDVYR